MGKKLYSLHCPIGETEAQGLYPKPAWVVKEHRSRAYWLPNDLSRQLFEFGSGKTNPQIM